MASKFCKRCKVEKDFLHFGRNSDHDDGLSRFCRKCVQSINAETRRRIVASVKVIPVVKLCSRCQIIKTSAEFQRDNTRKSGLHPYCKDCHAKKEKTPEQREKSARSSRMRRARYGNKYFSLQWWILKCTTGRLVGLTGAKVQEIYEQQNKKCFYCAVTLDLPTEVCIEHKTPLSRGGDNQPSNIAVACNDCNLLKHDRTELEFRAFLNVYVKRFQDARYEADMQDWAERGTGT